MHYTATFANKIDIIVCFNVASLASGTLDFMVERIWHRVEVQACVYIVSAILPIQIISAAKNHGGMKNILLSSASSSPNKFVYFFCFTDDVIMTLFSRNVYESVFVIWFVWEQSETRKYRNSIFLLRSLFVVQVTICNTHLLLF